jgi:biopolymer transport protein ExbD
MAGKSSYSDRQSGPVAEINITPFVDVVLVLLVIFMVTAPILVREQMNVELPKSKTGETGNAKDALITIMVDAEGAVSLDGKSITEEEFKKIVTEKSQANGNLQAVVRADANTRHKDVVKALDWVKASGVSRFAIQVERAATN